MNTEAYKQKGNQEYANGNFQKAVEFYTKAIDTAGPNYEKKHLLHSNRAMCYFQERNYDDCLTDCNLALLKEPKHIKSLIRRALTFEALEKLDKALEDYRTLRQIDPYLQQASEGSMRVERAIRLRKKTIDDEKNGHMNRTNNAAFTVAERVKKADEFKTRGNAYFQQGRNAEAIREYTKGLELDDSNAALLSNRAAAYTKIGEFDKAIDDADSAIKLKPQWPKGYYRKGLALYNMKMYVQASTALQKCFSLDRSNQQVQQLLSECNAKI